MYFVYVQCLHQIIQNAEYKFLSWGTHTFKMQIGTGAAYTLISIPMWKSIGKPIMEGYDGVLRTYGRESAKVKRV